MKFRIFLLSFLFFSLFSKAQFPNQTPQGNALTEVYYKGGAGVDSALHFRTSFADTIAANRGFLKNIPGLVIRVKDTLFLRNNTATKWINYASNVQRFAIEDNTGVQNRYNNFKNYGLKLDSLGYLFLNAGDNSFVGAASSILLTNGQSVLLSQNSTHNYSTVQAKQDTAALFGASVTDSSALLVTPLNYILNTGDNRFNNSDTTKFLSTDADGNLVLATGISGEKNIMHSSNTADGSYTQDLLDNSMDFVGSADDGHGTSTVLYHFTGAGAQWGIGDADFANHFEFTPQVIEMGDSTEGGNIKISVPYEVASPLYLYGQNSDGVIRRYNPSTAISGFVPYTGATSDVDLGSQNLITGGHFKGVYWGNAAGQIRFSDNTGADVIKFSNSSGFLPNLDFNGITAGRTATFQDASGTVAYLSDVSGKVNISDTPSMLSPYLRSNIAAATYATISNLALKNNISDTASMLSPYLRSNVAAATYQPLGSYLTSVSGTTNRITSSGGTTPVIDISASYVGQSSITTLGTIGVGVWQGTLVGSTYGGTGVNNGSSTITLGGNLVTSGAFGLTLTQTGTTNVTLPTTGTLLTTTGSGSSLTGIPTSVSNADGSLTITPTTGAVVASLNLANNNIWSVAQTITRSTTTTSTNGFTLRPATAALVGTPVRISPSLVLRTRVWNTGGTPASNDDDFTLESVGVSGNPTTATLNFSHSLNGAANTLDMQLSSSGNLIVGATNNIQGTATNNNAVAGNVGEEINSTISTYANYTTTATYQNITSIALTAGDWDISAFFTYSSNSATITAASNAIFVISTTTASAAGATEGQNIDYVPQAALLGTSKFSDGITPFRVSLSGNTTYYLNSQATFTLGNPQYTGSIRARRIR